MQNTDDASRRLRELLDELSSDEARELIDHARADARDRVRAILTDAFEDSMLATVRAQLGSGTRTASSASTAPSSQSAPVAPDIPPNSGEIPPETGDRTAPGGELGLYVYGVVSAREDASTAGVFGIEQSRPVGIVREGELAAIVSRVPLEEYGEEKLRAHLADMGWVERLARGHEAVLEELGRRTTVVPMRMCTVYRDERGVSEMLGRESDALQAALSHLERRSEWGLKMFADLSRVRAGIAAEPGEDEPGSTGTAYLERRRYEREETERAAAMIDQHAVDVHDALCAIAADGRVVPSQRPEVSGHSGTMVLNGVYLVDHDAESAFHVRIEELRAEFADAGLVLERTGPWPAYNFVPGTIGAGW